MAKNRQNRRRARRTTRRNVRRRNGRLRIPAAPPLQPFNRRLMNTVVRGSVIKQIQESSLMVVDFTAISLIAAYPQLVSCFKEVKVLKVNLWLYTTLSTASSGTITIVVGPKDEINQKATPATLASTPGSITRRVWQPLHGVYYPTEPDERNWFPVTTTKHLFVLQVIAKDLPKPGNALNPEISDVQIIWDAHVQFRGQSTDKADVIEPTVHYASDPDFELVNMESN